MIKKCHLKIGKHTATGGYLDIEVVGCQDQLKESALVNLEEICVPGGNVICSLLLVLVVLGEWGVILRI